MGMSPDQGPLKGAVAVTMFILVLALMGTGIVKYALPAREPVHQGHSLSFWFNELGTTNHSQAEIAIRQMGTRAVAFLLKKAKYADEDRVHEKLYRTIYNKLPVAIKGRIPLPKPFDDDFLYDGYRRL